jgi:hypothetical protein
MLPGYAVKLALSSLCGTMSDLKRQFDEFVVL